MTGILHPALLAAFTWILASFCLTPVWAQTNGMPIGTAIVSTDKGQFKFKVEKAETEAHKARGLMHRQTLAEDHGMIFTWPKTRHITMWMANTVLSLDMVFIKEDGTVHRVEQNTIPFSREYISSGGPVRQVLELNAGTASRIGLKPGDKIEIQ